MFTVFLQPTQSSIIILQISIIVQMVNMFTALCIKKTEVHCPCHKSLKLVPISWHVNPLQNAILHVRNKYRGADKSLVRPGRKQANISVRMGWICFGALPCRKGTWWQLASRFCWNRARPWHASEVISFLVGLRTFQHPGTSLSSFHLGLRVSCQLFPSDSRQ